MFNINDNELNLNTCIICGKISNKGTTFECNLVTDKNIGLPICDGCFYFRNKAFGKEYYKEYYKEYENLSFYEKTIFRIISRYENRKNERDKAINNIREYYTVNIDWKLICQAFDNIPKITLKQLKEYKRAIKFATKQTTINTKTRKESKHVSQFATTKPVHKTNSITKKKKQKHNIVDTKPIGTYKNIRVLIEGKKPKPQIDIFRNLNDVSNSELLDLIMAIDGSHGFIKHKEIMLSNIKAFRLSARIEPGYPGFYLMSVFHEKLVMYFEKLAQSDRDTAIDCIDSFKPIYDDIFMQKDIRDMLTIRNMRNDFQMLSKTIANNSNTFYQVNYDLPKSMSAKGISNHQDDIIWPTNINVLSRKPDMIALSAFVEYAHKQLSLKYYGPPRWEITITDKYLHEMGFEVITFGEKDNKCFCVLKGTKNAKFNIPSGLTDNICYNYAYAYCLIIFMDASKHIGGFTVVAGNSGKDRYMVTPLRLSSKTTTSKTVKELPRKRMKVITNSEPSNTRSTASCYYVPWYIRSLAPGHKCSPKAIEKAKLKSINLLDKAYEGMTYVDDYIVGHTSDKEFNKKLYHIKSMTIYSFVRSVFP